MNPHRYAHLPKTELEEIMLDMIRQTGFLRDVLSRAQELNLPNWRVVSGALYNTVWNELTGRPEGYGIKDVDILYYEPDTRWEAEERVIKQATGSFRRSRPWSCATKRGCTCGLPSILAMKSRQLHRWKTG